MYIAHDLSIEVDCRTRDDIKYLSFKRAIPKKGKQTKNSLTFALTKND